ATAASPTSISAPRVRKSAARSGARKRPAVAARPDPTRGKRTCAARPPPSTGAGRCRLLRGSSSAESNPRARECTRFARGTRGRSELHSLPRVSRSPLRCALALRRLSGRLGRLRRELAGLCAPGFSGFGSKQRDRFVQRDRVHAVAVGKRGVHPAVLHMLTLAPRMQSDRLLVLRV